VVHQPSAWYWRTSSAGIVRVILISVHSLTGVLAAGSRSTAPASAVTVELHVHPGCPHGFDRAAPSAAVVRRARADRLRVLGGF
jgi:hypothetical protein